MKLKLTHLNNFLSPKYFRFLILIAIFGAAFVLTAAFGLTAAVVRAYADKQIESETTDAAAIPQISASLQGEINGALSPEFPFNFESAENPFLDPTGVSLGTGKTAAFVQTNPAALPVGTGRPIGTGIAPAAYYPNYQPPNAVPSPTPNTSVRPQISGESLIKQRLERLNKLKKSGQSVPSLASAFTIDDIRPYGSIGSGDFNLVKLYSISTGTRFSVPNGTRFFDGKVVGMNTRGVFFERDSGERIFLPFITETNTSGGGGQTVLTDESDDSPIILPNNR